MAKFDFNNVATIKIDYYDLNGLLMEITENPIAESDIPEMLKAAMALGIPVQVTDPSDGTTSRLVLEGDKYRLK
jgi:hypothetical protein